MKKEWLLLISTVVVSMLLAIGLLRLFAPQMFGIPIDLQMVQVSKEVVPFYENVFRKEDYQSKEFLLKDPYVNVRARPLHDSLFRNKGPHDILGFRNKHIPNVADIVVLGDSQSYGGNARLEENWPSLLVRYLKDKSPVLYNMSTSGWGAVQYLDMFTKALLFQPRLVIVAFYSGNDPLESALLANSVKQWEFLKPDPASPLVGTPSTKDLWSDTWDVSFKDGTKTTFTPQLRLASNRDDEYVRAGYTIMFNVAEQISNIASRSKTHVLFTIIPTKELVYAKKVEAETINAPVNYRALVSAERKNIQEFFAKVAKLPGSTYVDLVTPLQQAALNTVQLYLPHSDGHPINAGYDEIAFALAPIVNRHLPKDPEGLLSIPLNKRYRPEMPEDVLTADNEIILVKDKEIFLFKAPELVTANGWKATDAQFVALRDIMKFPLREIINTVDPSKYGPVAFQ